MEKRQGNIKTEDREMEIKPQVLFAALDISNTNKAILNMIKRFYTSPKQMQQPKYTDESDQKSQRKKQPLFDNVMC